MKTLLARTSIILALTGFTAWGAAPTVERRPFGKTRDGKEVEMFVLDNGRGTKAEVITYGAIIYSIEVPDKQGKTANVTANRETLADYEAKSPCFGAVVGRFANRIGNARFSIDGTEYRVTPNAGRNHIHGGARGFDKVVWQGEPVRTENSAAVRLTYTSKDGEEGYPGTVQCSVLYELNAQNEWKMEYSAVSDKPTHVNLSNHAYWNLAGAYSGDVLNQVLQIHANRFLLSDDALVPTGEIGQVDGTPLDFRSPHAIGERIKEVTEKKFGGGYDHCFVIERKAHELVSCAKLKDPKSGRTMEVLTTQPGVQIYTANFPAGSFEGPGGYAYPRHLGVCLETQHYPNSPNVPSFPTTLLRPGETYHEVTVHRFSGE